MTKNFTHFCMICGHKMTDSDVIVFHGMTQCPNCYRDDHVVAVDSGICSSTDVIQQVVNRVKKK